MCKEMCVGWCGLAWVGNGEDRGVERLRDVRRSAERARGSSAACEVLPRSGSGGED